VAGSGRFTDVYFFIRSTKVNQHHYWTSNMGDGNDISMKNLLQIFISFLITYREQEERQADGKLALSGLKNR